MRSTPSTAPDSPLPADASRADAARAVSLAPALHALTSQPRPHERTPALDGVRGVAILMVMLVHFYSASSFQQVDSALAQLISALIRTGWTGVDLFFALSGFLITGILLQARGRPHYFRNFYARRSLRIFPLYYAVLALVLIATTAFYPLLKARGFASLADIRDNQWLLWIYGSNVYSSVTQDAHAFGPLGHFWSLAVEEHFYLFWPAVVALVPVRRLPWVCVALIVLANVLRASFLAYGNTIGAYCFTFCRTDAMAIGALLAWLTIYHPGGLVRLRATMVAIGATALAGVAGVMIWRRGLEYQDAAVLAFALPLIALTAGAIVGLASIAPASGPVGRVLGGRFLGFFGKYSYCMYVVHMPLVLLIPRVIDVPGLGFDMTTFWGVIGANVVGQAIGISLTSAIAVLSWHALEKHMLRLKRFFESK